MKERPLCIATISYIIGIIMGLYLQMSIVFLLCVCVIIQLFLYFIIHKKSIIILGLFIFIGFCSVKLVNNVYDEQYQLLRTNEEYLIEGIIVSDDIEKEYKTVYEIEVRTINGNTKYKGKKWILQIKKTKSSISKDKDYLAFGDLVIVYGTIEIPKTVRNYMGFDYQQYLKSQKIYGTINSEKEVEIIKNNQASIFDKFCNSIKNSMYQKLYQILSEEVAGLCMGILIGERQNLNEEVIHNFKESNLTHMLAVSGAHISYIVLGLTILLNQTRYRFRKVFVIIFLIFFMGLTGFTPSVQRSCIMTILTLIAGFLHRKQDVCTILCLSSLMILICNPYAILDIGFQLSYGGTLGIILFYEKVLQCFMSLKNIVDNKEKQGKKILEKIKHYVINAVGVTTAANLMIIPIMAFHFHTISFTFWISNLLAGPLLGIIIILGFVIYIVSLFATSFSCLIAIPLNFLTFSLIKIAEICSRFPLSSIMVRTPYIFEIVIYYLFLMIFFIKRKNDIEKVDFRHVQNCSEITKLPMKFNFIIYIKNLINKKIRNMKNISLKNKLKIIASILMIIFCVYGGMKWICPRKLEVYFVDVGQGDCTFIRTPMNKTILIDGGGSEMGTFNVGEKIVLPYLLDRKIMQIDYMMISHFDSDHVRFFGLFVTKNISETDNNRKAI